MDTDRNNLADSPQPRAGDSTLYVLLSSPHARKTVEKWARKNECEIWLGKQKSMDFVAISAFAMVIDRRLLGKSNWDFLISHTRDVNDGEVIFYGEERIDCGYDTACIMVDDIDHWPLPQTSLVVRLPEDEPGLAALLEISLDLAYRMARQ
jgi:hypothetical protein